MFSFKSPEDAVACRAVEDAPFWYPCCQIRERESPVGDIDDLAVTSMIRPVETPDWLHEMAVDEPENYIPGEIYNNGFKEPIRKLSEIGSCGFWEPKNEFYENFDPSSLPPITYPLYDDVCRRQTLQTIQETLIRSTKQDERYENEETPSCHCNRLKFSEHIHVPGANPCCLRNIVDKK